MSGECPVPLGALSPAGLGQSEDYGSARDDDLIEEAGPADEVSIGSDLSALVVPFPDLAPVVFFCLKQTTCPRSWCIRMVLSPWFERISIMVILLNCVTLGMYQPCENIDCASDHCQVLQDWIHNHVGPKRRHLQRLKRSRSGRRPGKLQVLGRHFSVVAAVFPYFF